MVVIDRNNFVKIICIQITGLFSIMSSGNFHIVSRFMILDPRHLDTPDKEEGRGQPDTNA